MYRSIYRSFGLFVVGLLSTPPVYSAEPTVSGHVFANYHYVVTGEREEQNKFQFEQIILAYDMDLADNMQGRLRLEAGNASANHQGAMEPFVKNAFLRYGGTNRAVWFGLIDTHIWSVSEPAWGYRPVQKTILDRQGLGVLEDMGIAFSGRLDGEGKADLYLMLGNGEGPRAESDTQKKLLARLHVKPNQGLGVAAYVDWAKRPGGQDRTTVAGVLYGGGGMGHGGFEAFVQWNKNQGVDGDVQTRGVSAFGRRALSTQIGAFARFDWYEPSDQASADQEYLFIGGLDLTPEPRDARDASHTGDGV